MAYSPKSKGLFEMLEKYNYHEMLVVGDSNLDLRGVYESEFIRVPN